MGTDKSSCYHDQDAAVTNAAPCNSTGLDRGGTHGAARLQRPWLI